MDWHDDTVDGDDGAGVEKAFTLLHEGPSRQQQGKASRDESADDITRSLQLSAYPELYKGEPEAARLARAAAATACWGALDANIQATLEGTDAGVFQALLSFAQTSHRQTCAGLAAAPSNLDSFHRLPTGLVLAGGVNSADHCTTFPKLAEFLRSHGCYVALLQPANFGHVAGDAVGEILRQVSGLAGSRAEHWAALAQWHADETAAESAAPAAPADGASGGSAAAAAAVEGEEEAAEAGGSKQGEARHLRHRPAAGSGAAGAAAFAAQLANRQRPVVVVIEDTERLDVQCLRDFVVIANEGCREVPLTLVLGLTTTAAALSVMLPANIMDRCLDIQHFQLATALPRLDSLVQQVLLGGSGRWPGLLFSQAIIGQLTDNFLNHYYSTGCVRQGLHVASLAHFRSQPASALAAAAVEGREALEEACSALEGAQLAQAKKLLKCRSPSQIADCVWEAMVGWSRWAVGLQWLVMAAEAVGLRSQAFRPWKLIEEALRQDFVGSQLKELLVELLPRLRKLSPAAALALATQLQQRAAAVWGGEEAAAEELQGMAAWLGEASGGQAEREQAGTAAAAGGDNDAAEEAERAGGSAQQQQQQEQEEEEDEEEERQVKKGKKKKRDVFHTKKSRNEALLRKAAEQAVAQGGSAAAAAQQRLQEEASPGVRLAAWLDPALRSLLGTLPTKLPGAVVFTCRDATSLDCLTAEPRVALHLALSEPHHYLPGLPEGLGVSSALEDACLAYRLFDQDPNCVNLADWYQAFASVHGHGQEQEDGEGGSGSGTTGAGTKRKKAAVKKGKGKAAAGGASGSGEAGADEAAALAELAARFSQATAELQYVGLIKPAKRRRGDYVQRMVHMPAAAV